MVDFKLNTWWNETSSFRKVPARKNRPWLVFGHRVIEVDDQRQHLVVSHDLHQLLGVPGVRVEVSLWEPFQFPFIFGYYIILYNII